MNEWLLFCIFLIAGLGMLILGIVYMQKEKSDAESVKIYRIISIIGAVLAAAALVIKFIIWPQLYLLYMQFQYKAARSFYQQTPCSFINRTFNPGCRPTQKTSFYLTDSRSIY